MISAIQHYTKLPLPLVDLLQHYIGSDCIIEKVTASFKASILTCEIPYIYEEKPRAYKIEMTKQFFHYLWLEDTYSCLKALESGASYSLSRDQIFKLAENEKEIALNILTAQISFKMKYIKIKTETQGKYSRIQSKLFYLDDAAENFAKAYKSQNEGVRKILLMFYHKYKKKEDAPYPMLSHTGYSDWEEEESYDHFYERTKPYLAY